MSQSDDEAQEAALSREEALLMHKANAQQQQQGTDHGGQARVLEKVLESELETTDDGITNLNAQDFPLSNYDAEVDTIEYKWLSEIINLFSKSRYPHPKSGLTGLSRAVASGDPGDRLEPLGLDELARDEAYLLGTYSRAKRGEDMAQQETSAKQITESHAIRDEGGSSQKSGLIGRAKSRFGR